MMKSTIKIYAFSAALMLGAVGCKKQLDLLPTDTIVEANAFQSVADLQRGLNTVYARYANYENSMFLASTLADEAKFGPDNGGQGQFVIRYQYNSDITTGGDVTAGWGAFYSMLDFCNRTLAKIDEIRGTTAEEAQKPAIRGQLLALRAAAHFELLQRFSGTYNPSAPGVPIVTTSNIFRTPARNTAGEVMNQIETDLNQAVAVLPATTNANFSDVVFNSININALRARVALYKRDWQAAANFASAIINANVRPLVASTQYASIWDDSNLNIEVLFRIKRNGAGIGATWFTTGNLIHFSPTDKLRATFDAVNDVRFANFFTTFGGANRWAIRKYLGSALGGRINDTKVFRTAEMHLIRAEALAEIGGTANLAQATADINLLRSRRITGYTNQTFATAADIINAVLEERYKELCFEGFRFFDLKRRGLPVQRQASDVDGTNWLTLPADNFRFLLPIPVAELQANPNMVQNPGY